MTIKGRLLSSIPIVKHFRQKIPSQVCVKYWQLTDWQVAQQAGRDVEPKEVIG